jgi:DNA mismatch repair protein MutS2
MPGTSNAIEIAKRLGLNEALITTAKQLLSGEKSQFENVLREAEKIRNTAEKEREELSKILSEEKVLHAKIKAQAEKLDSDREKFMVKAKADSRKLVNEKLETAEELLAEMKEIFKKDVYNQSDLVKMSTLKNKIESEKYNIDDNTKITNVYKPVDLKTLKQGDKVYVLTMDSEGIVSEIKQAKNQVWVNVGSIRINVKSEDLSLILDNNKKQNATVSIKRSTEITKTIQQELNVIGKNVDEALMEVENFIDKAIMSNLDEVRIVHGKGLRILSKAIQNYLKTDKRVDSFRFGKYGEGEDGVTIVKLK